MSIKRFLYALFVFGVSAALYWCFLADWFLPNTGANLAASLNEVVSYADVTSPIWVKLANHLPIEGTLAFRTGIISVAFGAFAACLVAYIAATVWGRIAAFAATIVFLLTPGIFVAATHADPALIDLTIALFAIALVARRWSWLTVELVCAFIAGALIGAGVSESPIFFLAIAFALIFLIRLDYEEWYHALVCLLVFALGMVLGFNYFTLYFYGAAFYRAPAVANLRRLIYLTHSVPFFKMVILAYLPCAIEMFFRLDNQVEMPMSFQRRMGWTVYAVQFMVSSAVVVAILPCLTFVDTGDGTASLAYVSIAFALGGALTYWRQLFSQGKLVDVIEGDDEERGFTLRQYSLHSLAKICARKVGAVMLCVFPVVWAIAVVWMFLADGVLSRNQGRAVYDYCCEMVREAGTNRVFLTDTSLDGIIGVAAQMEGIEGLRFEKYDLDSEMIDAIREGTIDRTRPAIFGPAFWTIVDSKLKPDIYFYSLAKDDEEIDFAAIAKKWLDVWSRYGEKFDRRTSMASAIICAELASQGNYIACALMENNDDALAEEILRTIYHQVNPNNLTTAINLSELARLERGTVTKEFGEECKAKVTAYIANHGNNMRLFRQQVMIDGKVYKAPDVDKMQREALEKWKAESPIGIESVKFTQAIEAGDFENARLAIEAIAELDQSDARLRAISTMMKIEQAATNKDVDARSDALDEMMAIDLKDLRQRDGVDGAYYQAVLGQWLLAKGGRDYEARIAFRASVTANARFRVAAQQLLTLDMKLNDIESARADAMKILRTDAYSPMANLIIGSAYGEAGELEKAVKHLKRAIVSKDAPDVAYNDLAETLYREGKYDEALKYANIAYEKMGDVEAVKNLIDKIRAAQATQP